MNTVFTLLVGAGTICAVVGFIGSFVAYIQLQFYIDYDRVKKETGEPGWKLFGSLLAPAEFYKKEAKIIWKIQRIGIGAFAISLGCIAVLMLVAAALGIQIK